MGINLTEISQKVLDTVHNASTVFRRMYDLHYNPEPIDVELEYIDEDGVKKSVNIPNISKINSSLLEIINGGGEKVEFVSTSEELLGKIQELGGVIVSPIVFELEDGTYRFNEQIKLNGVGRHRAWVILRSKSGDKEKVTIEYDGSGSLFECNDSYLVCENLTFDGLSNTEDRTFIQLNHRSFFGSIIGNCIVKNFKTGIESDNSFFIIDSWEFSETMFPIIAHIGSYGYAKETNFSITPNDSVESIAIDCSYGSFLECSKAKISGFTTGVFVNASSTVIGNDLQVDAYKDFGIISYNNSYIQANNSNFDGAYNGSVRGNFAVRADAGAIDSYSSTFANTQHALFGINNGVIRANNCTASNIRTKAVTSSIFSLVEADRFNVSSGDMHAYVDTASVITAYGSNLNYGSGSPSWSDKGIIRK